MLLNINEKKTKIVCTIGPATDNYESILALYKAGMNVMRINFSHGVYEEHMKKIAMRDRLEEEGIYIPWALDTKGPEIRTGYMENGRVEVKEKQKMRITMDASFLGNKEKFATSYKGLYDDVNIGDRLLIDDGNLEFKVTGKDPSKKELLVVAMNAHILKDQKGINAPVSKLQMPFISKKDADDVAFGCTHGADMIFASFTRRPEDVLALKKICAKNGRPDMPIFVKIENPEGVEKFEEIIKVADGAMVARGDLGVEIPPEQVPIVQKRMIRLCRIYGKPVIVATQMLDSMVTHPRPTRAEVGDVATAVAESSDCIMLSAETASGKYPIEAVEMMTKISNSQEQYLDYARLADESFNSSEHTNNDAIANASVRMAMLIGAKLIVNFTETGKSTIRISKARPCCPIVSVTNRLKTARVGAAQWGVYSVLIKTPMPDFVEEMEVLALKIARNLNIKAGEPIILTGGTPTGAGQTNFLRILKVNSVKEFE